MINYNDAYKFYTSRIKASYIIGSKKVNVPFLEKCSDLKRYNEYAILNGDYQDKLLTKEEFDLLKEFLEMQNKLIDDHLRALVKAKYKMYKGCRGFHKEYGKVDRGKKYDIYYDETYKEV